MTRTLTEVDRMRVNEVRRKERLTAYIWRDENLIRQLERNRDDPQIKEGIRLARRRIWANSRALEEMGPLSSSRLGQSLYGSVIGIDSIDALPAEHLNN